MARRLLVGVDGRSGGQVGGRQDEEQQGEQHSHGGLLVVTGVESGRRVGEWNVGFEIRVRTG
jgi:hypothetical protein